MEQLREASQAPNNDGKLYVSETVCSRFVSYVHLLIHLIVSNSADIDDHLLSPCNQEEDNSTCSRYGKDREEKDQGEDS